MLYLAANAFKPKKLDTYAYSIHLSLEQRVTVDRNQTSTLATTWSISSTGVVGSSKLKGLREAVKDWLDDFINAFLAMNSK